MDRRSIGHSPVQLTAFFDKLKGAAQADGKFAHNAIDEVGMLQTSGSSSG